MKLCKDCKHCGKVAQQQGNEYQLAFICKHSECCDIVTGDPLLAGQARSVTEFCGFEARYFEAKENDKSPIPDRPNIITLEK